MELDELAKRLGVDDLTLADNKEQADQAAFMDRYGSRLNMESPAAQGIGVAILAELNRRGIDTSAADEAVQDILDQIRFEATQVLDAVNMQQTAVSNLMDKVNTVAEGVQAATGAAPGAPPLPGAEEGLAPLPSPDTAGGPPLPGAPPEAGMTGGSPPLPPDIPPSGAAPGGGAPIPPEGEPPGPPPIPSDVRLKNLRSKMAAAPKKEGPPSYLRVLMQGMR